MRPGITVCTPTIPPRANLLARAVLSIMEQTHPAAAISIAIDNTHAGSGPTRTRALRAVQTEWTAFFDDDDVMLPEHLARLVAHQAVTLADVVWPWFHVNDGTDPFPQHRGRQWDPADPHIFPIATLARTELAQQCEFPVHESNGVNGDDFRFWNQMSDLGANFSHTEEITWVWDHNPPGGNTSGLPTRW